MENIMKKFYTVDIMDGTELISENVFDGTFEECIEYIAENDHTTETARICEYTNDGEDICTDIITEW